MSAFTQSKLHSMPNGNDTVSSGAGTHVTNFIRNIIEADLAAGKWSPRGDKYRIRTRFPPEPNGYLHIGHAKSICLNFGLAKDFGGACHMRFDDTNPEKEEQEYVDTILDSVKWLGWTWEMPDENNLFYASDYFDRLYEFAEKLVEHGLAYVDSQSAEEMRTMRGTLTEPGRDSPYRKRPVAENLKLLREMRDGKHADGTHVLRARIDMASPNINLRDPALYRIKHASHHRTGDKWCIYPMYSYAHPVEDAIENVTHSICTLEFEDQRPFYDWVLEKLAEFGVFKKPLPQQIEFSRLNLTYVVMSKRFLLRLVEEKHVDGWDDPRMPTLVGCRRRGFTPEGFRLFAERIGVSKADSWIDYSVLEDCMREDLNQRAERRIAVLNPLKLIIENYPAGKSEECFAPNHPQHAELGKRPMPFSRELWIERDDYMDTPSKGYFRLYPGNEVRLRYGFVIKCLGADKDAAGNVTAVRCEYYPETKSGTPGADSRKVKGNIHWVCAASAYHAEVRLYDRLFKVPHPGTGGREYLDDINPDAKQIITAYLEPSLKDAEPEATFQFERHGYFVADMIDSRSGTPVFNRAVTMKDSWAKGGK
jgi:glutaminyl-tRNA synthetase